MDTTPIYDLRERLRAVAMAGTNLLSEDFRLKRAFEAFKPLEAASPVFAKVGQLTEQLLSPDCQNIQGALLDTITLVDAVICTLGAVDVTGGAEAVESIHAEEHIGSLIVNAPYSILKELLEALTTSGGGHYAYVCDTRDNHPELFRDYRIKYALVQALGAAYAELADKAERWLEEDNDKSILPALYKDFDPKGKKEMVRRVRVIGALAGAEANDFYVQMLSEAQKEVRTELIDALRYEQGNIPLLLDMAKTEKGKNKDKVLELLADMEDARACGHYKEMAKKKPETILKYLKNASTEWASEMVAGICDKMLEEMNGIESASDEEKQKMSSMLQDVIRAMFGKGGAAISTCYCKLLSKNAEINRLLKETWKKPKDNYTRDTLSYGVLQPYKYGCESKETDIETALGRIMHHSLMANPDPDIQALALELYQKDKKFDIRFLSAAAAAKFLSDENCVDWLEEQVTEKVLFQPKLVHKRMEKILDTASYVRWDARRKGYQFCGYYTDTLYPDLKGFEHPVRLSHAKEYIAWIQKYALGRTDDILFHWIALDDKEMCAKMGEYFYRRALETADSRNYLDYMRTCGWTKCSGLAVHYFKSRQKLIHQWTLHDYVQNMPGDSQAKREEAQKLSEMMKTGEVNQGNITVSYFDEWISKNL